VQLRKPCAQLWESLIASRLACYCPQATVFSTVGSNAAAGTSSSTGHSRPPSLH
jgi:hypothetical protein